MLDSFRSHALQHTRLLLSSTISQSLLKRMSIELVLLSDHLTLCHPLLLLPSVLPSIRVFLSEPALRIRWPEYYFRVLPSRCYLAAKSCLTLCDPMDCSTPGSPSIPITRSLLKLVSIESVVPSNHLILCCCFVLLPSIFPSTMVFSSGSLHQVAKVLELQPQHQSFQ